MDDIQYGTPRCSVGTNIVFTDEIKQDIGKKVGAGIKEIRI